MADSNDSKKKRDFGISRLMGLPYLAAFTKSITGSAREMIKPRQSEREETFEEAVTRLQLTEEDIQKRKKQFLNLAISFGVFAFVVLCYTVYLFWNGHILAGILGVAVTIMILTQVFRYHFWHFQMKKRKLGCTLKEWLKS